MNRRPFMVVPLLLVLTGCTALGKIGQVLMDPSIPVGAPGDQPTEVAFSLYASPTLNGNPYSLDAAVSDAQASGTYTVSLSADDPHALAEKVEGLLEQLHEQYPALSLLTRVPEAFPESADIEEGGLGQYRTPTADLSLPAPSSVPTAPIATPIAIKILQLRDDSLFRNSLYQLLDQDPAKALRSTYIRDDDYLLSPGQFKFVRFEPLDADTRFIAVVANYSNHEDAIWRQVLRIEPRGRKVVLGVQVNDAQILLTEES
ncbi:type VI secretion system lipoprotein TssJ [Pseudomonas monteilii]|nr:type VI secretion system lipoprotein TssJ [Pseudomonas monteilii]